MIDAKEEIIAKMHQALQAYKQDKTSAKPFAQSMREISAWLQSKGK